MIKKGWKFRILCNLLDAISIVGVVISVIIALIMLEHPLFSMPVSHIYEKGQPVISFVYPTDLGTVSDGEIIYKFYQCSEPQPENTIAVPFMGLKNCFRIRTDSVMPIISSLFSIACVAFMLKKILLFRYRRQP